MDKMRLRQAHVTDADAIAALHVASWRETYSAMLPQELLAGLSVEARSAMWCSVLSGSAGRDGTSVFVAESRSGIVGFGACGTQRDTNLREKGFDAEIGAIYILEVEQHGGLGKGLMGLMAASLLDGGRKAVSLWVIRENAPARRSTNDLVEHYSARKTTCCQALP
jgi:hypothetical protein